MKQGNAIEVHNITKTFKVYYDKGTTLKEKVLFSNRRRFERREVLKGISFEVKKGEAIALIGHNGCGKSTTLKMLTKIMYPDSGKIEMSGRVSSLIELGAGFHPDMSGRENIYINAAIFGLQKNEIDRRLHDIIAFSELEEFIDNPVRTYSSGMYMRLAFSVAINVDADILLIDEILGVGDAGFQSKCFNKLQEIKAKGTTIVLVSHSMGQVEQICDRSIWIHNGLIEADGLPRDVDPMYLNYMAEERVRIANLEAAQNAVEEATTDENVENLAEKSESEKAPEVIGEQQETSNEQEQEIEEEKKRYGNGKARIKSVSFVDDEGNKTSVIKTGNRAAIRIDYEGTDEINDIVFGVGFFRADGQYCYGTNTMIDRLEVDYSIGHGVVEFVIPRLELIQGKYTLDVAIEEGQGIPVDYWKEALEFEMYSVVGDVGVARIEHEWKLDGKKLS